MMNLIYVLLGAAVVYFAFKKSVIIGLIALAALLGIMVYILYPKLKIARANAKFNDGDLEGTIRDYKRIIESGKGNIDLRITYASLLMRADEAEKGLDEINKILKYKIEPKKKYLAKQTRSMINYRLGNMQEAKEELDELFEDGYKTSNTYCMMGLYMLIMNYPIEETLKMCEEAYEYDDDNRDILDNLEVCYIKTKQYDKAKEISDKLVELAPQFVEGFYHGALLHEAMGDMKTAKEYAARLKDCKRSVMTTIPVEEEEKLIARLS